MEVKESDLKFKELIRESFFFDINKVNTRNDLINTMDDVFGKYPGEQPSQRQIKLACIELGFEVEHIKVSKKIEEKRVIEWKQDFFVIRRDDEKKTIYTKIKERNIPIYTREDTEVAFYKPKGFKKHQIRDIKTGKILGWKE